jgi:ligand-binding sensor domain-containing protein
MRSFIPCIFILFLAFSTAAQTDKLYTSFDGLSNAEITAIIQDNKGIMWIGTARGVNKYDGYSFEVFVNDPADSNSFQSNRIEALASDSKGQVWAGISKGLYRYNKINNKFERFSLLFEGRHTYPKVADIQEDKYKNRFL